MKITSVVRFAAALTILAATAAPQDTTDAHFVSRDLSTFRQSFNTVLDQYDAVFSKLGHARGRRLIAEARERMQAVSDDQLRELFTKTPVPDLSPLLQATRTLAAETPVANVSTDIGLLTTSPAFPGAPPILSDCNNIVHSSSFTFGALIAFQVARGILAAAEFACEEVVVVLGEGGNGAAVCIPFAIAEDAAAIPFELASFCQGEEDSALLQGSFDRLDHIHTDLDNAKGEVIDAISANTAQIIDSVDSNTTLIVGNDNANRALIINNDNSNREQIVSNDNANREQIINEVRALGCELVRLLNTPEGRRSSSILACEGQPGFPYDFPERP